MKPIRLMAGFLTVGFWTLASRVLGFVREVLILAYIGPGPVMDAFVAAFRLPNMFRRFFAEGAFNAAFVPMFSKKYEGEEDPQQFARDAFNGLALVVLALTGLAMVFMPALVWATAEGFVDDERFELTVGYGRIVFPYILFMSLAALFSGILNATGRFAAAAAAPVLLNIFVIVAMIVGAQTGGPVILWLLWAIPLAGIAQLALVWGAARKAGISVVPGRPRWTPDMKRMIVVAVPAALASGVLQVNLLVGQLVASSTPGALSWLYAADRLYQLPLGVVGIAVGVVLLPSLSRHLKSGDDAASRAAFSRAGEISLALTLPAAVALVVVPLPLVSVLYERGQTTSDDSAAIAVVVAIYGLGLPAFVMQKVLQPLFFAREDTRRPFHYAAVAMVVNAVLAVGLSFVIGWIAAAIAATAAAWVQMWLLLWGARDMGPVARFDARFRRRLWRIGLASALMGAVLWGAMLVLGPLFGMDGVRYVALALLIGAGITSYFTVAHLIGALPMSDIRQALRRRA
ncbi:murein biosynthesis integral membrane protein MurJ [Lutimaribacter sp. EGI FJ00015]|uniref:Murein biosynthesis integral membrane protein MurJ n=1 Tax=Lutimaribacter degradans TaxID=2945989 RepID=A0ACC5ZZH2_9RHOB|nr:murein biosynthesis integral membrane protein MurJ [Lutimaribacter sp. EGI FJ00013]MCM2563505.1 murein biosynthesis integral membrane protein MurJ [Lutimaribacter sp. EGI FJ00013]MCO0614685.1 murein biosynthesis integral membrane protein MurJ [Lutimaribacter sp. EGI FJ00015]MCO0637355.1 murein biosynthesis integral membrane protein MurJ [Lutimaribacter sp. EGI FJ00014]